MLPEDALAASIKAMAAYATDTAITLVEGTAKNLTKKLSNQRKKKYGFFKEYLEKSCEVYAWQKTFFYRHAPIYLYDYYVPLRVKMLSYGESEFDGGYKEMTKDIQKRAVFYTKFLRERALTPYYDEAEIEDAFSYENEVRLIKGNAKKAKEDKALEIVFEDKPANRSTNNAARIILTGQGGCGKSTLMRHLFIDAIASRKKIPVLIELRDLNFKKNTLVEYITLQFNRFGKNVDEDVIYDCLSKGLFIILIDGMDEVYVSQTSKIEREIIQFAEHFEKCPVILSSRPYQDFLGWHAFTQVKVMPLDEDGIKGVVQKAPIEEKLGKKFLAAILPKMSSKRFSFITNPLLLAIVLLTYRESLDIPEKLHNFFEQAYSALYNRHDALESGFKRERVTNLAIDDFASILEAFSILTYFQQKTKFQGDEIHSYLSDARGISHNDVEFNADDYIIDLRKSLCLLVPQGLHIVFVHRTFQEYFTARYLKNASEETVLEIIPTIEGRRSRDNVIGMFADMNPSLFERSYLIPLIQEIRDAIDHEDGNRVNRQMHLRYMRMVCDTFLIKNDGLYPSQDLSGGWTDTIAFIRERYLSHQVVSDCLSKEMSMDVADLELHDAFADGQKIFNLKKRTSKLTPRMRGIKEITTYPGVLSEPMLRALISLQTTLRAKHDGRSNSVVQILRKRSKNC